jgi:hypothetical protein
MTARVPAIAWARNLPADAEVRMNVLPFSLQKIVARIRAAVNL